MAYITFPGINEMDEAIKQELEKAREKMGDISEIVKVLALRPDIYHATTTIFKTLMVNKTELSKHIKESIAILISKENGCQVCVGEHERIAKMLGMPEKQINDVLNGLENIEIPENERVLLRFCIKSASKENYKIMQKDIDEVRAAGYSDFQILEAVAIVGYFNYINTISNSLGVGK